MGSHQHINVNTGVYFVKATPGGKHFMAKWAGLREQMKHDNDQVGWRDWCGGRCGARCGGRCGRGGGAA